MTVAELRKALEGLPDDMLVVREFESWMRIVDKTSIEKVPKINSHTNLIGLWLEGMDSGESETVFVIS